jgi:hypothetical protein
MTKYAFYLDSEMEFMFITEFWWDRYIKTFDFIVENALAVFNAEWDLPVHDSILAYIENVQKFFSEIKGLRTSFWNLQTRKRYSFLWRWWRKEIASESMLICILSPD